MSYAQMFLDTGKLSISCCVGFIYCLRKGKEKEKEEFPHWKVENKHMIQM